MKLETFLLNMSSYLGSPYSSGCMFDEYDFDDERRDYYDEIENLDPESDEDTEDASETDMHCNQDDEFKPTEIKEQMYLDKLAALKKQVQQLNDGINGEYNRVYKRLSVTYHDRLRMNHIWQEYEMVSVESDYVNEKKAAAREFEEKKIELRENLIADLEEKKRIIEIERNTMELTGDSMEVKPVTTRKLRRRPNDPVPVPEKRRKPAPAQLCYLLDERSIEDDMKVVNQAKMLSQVKKPGSTPSTNPTSHSNALALTENLLNEAKIEDGKLFYERRWFHRGQQVSVESKEGNKFSGVISGIASDMVWIRKAGDTTKVRIYLAQLQKGKYVIKRRAA